MWPVMMNSNASNRLVIVRWRPIQVVSNRYSARWPLAGRRAAASTFAESIHARRSAGEAGLSMRMLPDVRIMTTHESLASARIRM